MVNFKFDEYHLEFFVRFLGKYYKDFHAFSMLLDSGRSSYELLCRKGFDAFAVQSGSSCGTPVIRYIFSCCDMFCGDSSDNGYL